MKQPLFVIYILSIINISFGVKLNVVKEWKYVDFVWESPQQKQQAIDSGSYNPAAVALIDVDKAPDGRLFVTTIRGEIKDVPVAVMTVTNETGEGGPLLRPYPDWSWYKNNDCNGNSIVGAVFQLRIKCNYLFILDGGKNLVDNNQLCPAQLLIFDLSTDKLIKRITFPLNISNNKNGEGVLSSLIVHAPDCRSILDTAIILMGDAIAYGLAVYNMNTSKVCRIETSFMRPTHTTFTIANQSYHLEDGIEGMTIIDNDLYYVVTAGNGIFKMEISKLKDCTLTDDEANKETQVVATLSGQTGHITSKDCAIFFSNFPKMSLMCADASKNINSDNMEVFAQDSEKLQTPYGIKLISQNSKDELLIMSNRIQRMITNTRKLNETMFRILSVDVADIRKETNCFASCN